MQPLQNINRRGLLRLSLRQCKQFRCVCNCTGVSQYEALRQGREHELAQSAYAEIQQQHPETGAELTGQTDGKL